MSRLARRLRREEGQGIVQALLLLAGVLLPLMFLVALFGRIEQGRLAAEQSARDAVRAASQAASEPAAEQAANDALARAQQQSGLPLSLDLQGELQRGATLTATTSVEVTLADLPFFGQLGTITIHGQARAPVDQYRSLDPNSAAAP
jgi:multidrug efflux pump subunit AcrA (membrane-fusion protein)